MATFTTTHILANKALQEACGKECVDWAMSMVEQEYDGEYLLMLAGMRTPFNHFEIAEYRDKALKEVGATDLIKPIAISNFVLELLQSFLAGEVDLISALKNIKDLCVASDHQRELYDFYLLYFAYVDLQEHGDQHYWDGATKENIIPIINQCAISFIKSNETSS